jgi:hypothetical protein
MGKDPRYLNADAAGKARMEFAYQQLAEAQALQDPNNPLVAEAKAAQAEADSQGFLANMFDKTIRSHKQAFDVAPRVADAMNPDGSVATDFGAWSAKYFQKQQAAPRTYEDKKLDADLTQRIKAWNDGGPTEKVQAAFGILGDILTNPKAAMYAGADSASSITAMLLGAKTGGLIGGAAAGPVGATVGTVVGTVGASASHSAALKFMELVQKGLDEDKIPYTASNIQSWMENNTDKVQEYQTKSTKYGMSMGVADAAFGAVGGKVATTFERAALRQANASALAPVGKAAISEIVQKTGSTVEDATQAYIQSQARNTLATQTFKSKVGYKATGLGTEIISEPATEAIGTLSAGEELSAKELIMEAVGGVGAGPYGAAVNTSIFGTKIAGDQTKAFAKKLLASTPESRAAEKEQKAEIKAATLQRQSPAHFQREVAATDPTDPKVDMWADHTNKETYDPIKAVTVLAKTVDPDSTVVEKARAVQNTYLDELNKDYDKYDELQAQFDAVKDKDKAAEVNLESQLVNQRALLKEKRSVYDQVAGQVTLIKNAALEVGKDKPVDTPLDNPATIKPDDLTDHITQSFGSRDTTPDEQITELLKRSDLSAEHKTMLQDMADSNAIRKVITDRATSGKSMDQVSADIYHGPKGSKFKGIDSYKQGVREALTSGNTVQLTKELEGLKAFRDAHVTKDQNVTEILAAMKSKEGLSKEQSATYLKLQRENSNFELHPITSVGMAGNIKREAAALNAEVKLAESLIAVHKTKGQVVASPTPSSPVVSDSASSSLDISKLSFPELQSMHVAATAAINASDNLDSNMEQLAIKKQVTDELTRRGVDLKGRPLVTTSSASTANPASSESSVKYGFKLSQDKLGKDQGKADVANAFIGYGALNRKSSTGQYAADAKSQNIPVNEAITPDATTRAFVSVSSEGIYNIQTIEQAGRILDAGGTVIMDASGTNKGQSHSPWNAKGEGAVQDALIAKYGAPKKSKQGYNVWSNVANKGGDSSGQEEGRGQEVLKPAEPVVAAKPVNRPHLKDAKVVNGIHIINNDKRATKEPAGSYADGTIFVNRGLAIEVYNEKRKQDKPHIAQVMGTYAEFEAFLIAHEKHHVANKHHDTMEKRADGTIDIDHLNNKALEAEASVAALTPEQKKKWKELNTAKPTSESKPGYTGDIDTDIDLANAEMDDDSSSYYNEEGIEFAEAGSNEINESTDEDFSDSLPVNNIPAADPITVSYTDSMGNLVNDVSFDQAMKDLETEINEAKAILTCFGSK